MHEVAPDSFGLSLVVCVDAKMRLSLSTIVAAE